MSFFLIWPKELAGKIRQISTVIGFYCRPCFTEVRGFQIFFKWAILNVSFPLLNTYMTMPIITCFAGLKIILGRWPDTMIDQRNVCSIKSCFLTG